MATDIVQIRATHHYGFRSGEWATLLGVVWANNRPCYSVLFSDWVSDLWPVHDEWDAYEFRKLEKSK